MKDYNKLIPYILESKNNFKWWENISINILIFIIFLLLTISSYEFEDSQSSITILLILLLLLLYNIPQPFHRLLIHLLIHLFIFEIFHLQSLSKLIPESTNYFNFLSAGDHIREDIYDGIKYILYNNKLEIDKEGVFRSNYILPEGSKGVLVKLNIYLDKYIYLFIILYIIKGIF